MFQPTLMGIDAAVSDKTIEICHDRTRVVQVKHFLRENVNVMNLPTTSKSVHTDMGDGMAIVSDLQWKDASTVEPILEELMSYISIMDQLHPIDYGPMNILRAVIKWQRFAFHGDQVWSLKTVINPIANPRCPPRPWTSISRTL